jgi:vancomycin resistance protein YoaR
MDSLLPRSPGAKIFLIFALLALSAIAGLLAGDYFYAKERFPKNTFIEKVEVSRLTVAEATEKLSQYPVDRAMNSKITLAYSIEAFQGAFELLPSDLGLSVDPELSIRKAFGLMHGKNFIRVFARRFSKDKIILPLSYSANQKVLKRALTFITPEVNSVSQDAKVIIREKGAYNIIKEVPGKTLEIDQSIQLILVALEKNKRVLPLAIKLSNPRIIASDLREAPPVYQLSKYQTYYGTHDSPNRIHNIKTIAGWLDGYILRSGESFSLLNQIGDFTEERGFKEAFVIIGDELVPELGGGTCQIATTLYNSALLSDLEIIKRQNHSIWFNIYPVGRDATVYPPYTDLQFKNNTGHPIMISAKATGGSLTFRIYGTPTSKEVSVSSPSITYWSSEEGKKITGWRLPGPNRQYSTKVDVVVKQNGEVIKKYTLKSFYEMEGDRGVVKIRRPEPR